jgi:hypothetical protein
VVLLVALAYACWTSPLAPVLAGIMTRGATPGLDGEPFYPPPDATIDATLRSARAVLNAKVAGQPPPEARPTGLDPERECLLSLYIPQGGGKVGPYVAPLAAALPDGGVGPAIEVLFEQFTPDAPSPAEIAASRLKIDCVVGGERSFPFDGGHRGMALDQGLDGIILRVDGREPFRWLPSWAIERPVARRRMHRSARRLARRLGGWKKREVAESSFAAFRTRSYVEAASGAGIVPLVRANAEAPPLESGPIREAISLAGAYLARETDGRGKLTYHYDDRKDSVEGGYNLLRHAGSTYSMLQAYRISGDPAVLEASERAIGYFRRKMREDSEHPGEWFAVEGRRAKLGAVGLGLLMFVEHAKVAPERAHDPELLAGMADRKSTRLNSSH